MNTNHKSIVLAISLFFALATSISAAPGDLDPTFGNGGIVIGGVPYTLANAEGMALQADGKIVVVGDAYDFRVARYNPNGSLDTSFGGGGVVVTPGIGSAYSVAIQADGKIVVAGGGFAVVRYNPNGSLDTTFNGTGIVSTQINNGSSHARSVAIQSDGKIVVAGDNSTGPFTLAFAIVRYNTNGSLDTSFDNDGIVTTQVGSGFEVSGAEAVAIQADGKIVAAGYYNGLVRYNADGSLDTTFNGTGIVTTPGRGASSVAIQADGKILTTGGNGLVRYNANGTPDTSFGGTGGVAVGIGVSSVAIQADGKIVAAGGTYSAFAVTRLHGNGSPDTSFGGTGTVITPFDPQVYSYVGASAVAIQPDGKIVAAGAASDFSDNLAVALVRYQGDSATSCPNPIDCADFFVRQHYLDFLNREPDLGGWNYWTTQLTSCGNDIRCMHERRIGVSAAFFVELEFQRTGYVVYRMHRAAFGTWPGAPTRANLTYAQFTADRALLPEGSDIAQTTINFANAFVARPEFLTVFPANQTNAEFVNKLFDTAGLTPYTTERQQQIAAMNTGRTRAQVLLDVIEIPEFKTREYNRSFVLMEYFGYLQRDPDQGGYDFWLNVLDNREPNNFRGMVCSFITSTEYQLRFGSTMTRSNADCGQ